MNFWSAINRQYCRPFSKSTTRPHPITRSKKAYEASIDALAAARQATQIATERYDRGLTDFLNVLDAERQEFDLEQRQVMHSSSGGRRAGRSVQSAWRWLARQ